ncbi:MAG TPA: sulfocyanin-like copper-binding protein [Solirubrobacteraceae bacterium]|nr:sulfocyanin-like copper-binding protein [Solirubrobacteraceae bacterium]
MIRWAALLTVALALGFGTAALSAPHHRPAKRCHRQRHHRRCPPPRHKPRPKPGKPTSIGTTTTPVTTPAPPATTTTPTGPLPSRLEVDENDQPYSLFPSHDPVAAGVVKFNLYNFGQDDHTFAVVDSHGNWLAFAKVPANQPQTAVPVGVNLPAGRYTLECTLPGHANLGMVASLTVR